VAFLTAGSIAVCSVAPTILLNQHGHGFIVVVLPFEECHFGYA
jgi:hypothetical protein